MAWQGFTMWKGWRGQAESGGGRFLDLGAHLVDQMCMLFPDPIETVYCRMHHDDPSSDIETEALLVITFAGGKTGVIDTSSKTAVSKPRFLVHGSNATFVKYGLDPQEAAMKAGDIDSATEDEMNYGQLCNGVTERIIPTIAGRWRNYYENIAHVLTNGEKPEVKYEEMYRTMAILDAGIRSAKTGKAIQVNIPGL
jgi:scyllo-inositol 2-dehydrogenase (NADP+)